MLKPLFLKISGVCLGLSLGASLGFAEEPGTRLEQVKAHLAAGEFGQAADLAKAAGTAQEKTDLLTLVAQAQLNAGEASSASHTIRNIPDKKAQRQEAGRKTKAVVTGGGLGANFQPLIDLIQEEIPGPWTEIDGEGGTITQFDSGVRVDPHGLLQQLNKADATGRLTELGVRARSADLNADMAKSSELRMVSLTRLEKEVAKRLEEGKPVVESMKQLAGLSRIQYVFVLPEEHEVIIAGPAEGWKYNDAGLPIGTTSHHPTLQLDDLVTVLRTFSAAGQHIFGCSIDPRPEGLKAVKEFVEKSLQKGPLEEGQSRSWADKIGKTLGRQDISIYGVPKNSRVARVILEADYRMKLIGIGKVDGGKEIPDYFKLLAKNPGLAQGSLDALRWWLTMKYDTVLHSPDHTAYEIQGSTVLCQSENQHITSSGGRAQTGKAEPINQKFAANFTEHYAALAAKDLVFSDLQGIFDMALVAALINHDQLDQLAAWNPGVFGPAGAYQTATFNVPKECDSVVNHRVFNGKDVVVQVAGGVTADIGSVVKSQNQESAQLKGTAATHKPTTQLPANRWWWDAK